MKRVAAYLSSKGYILRSGGADGADSAFEAGATDSEIYLPWKNFNNKKGIVCSHHPKAIYLAKQFHPRYSSLSNGTKKLMIRNSHQIFGTDMNTPSDFVICWTKDGKGGGGTGQALRIAKHYRIPIFDIGNYTNMDVARRELYDFLKPFTTSK
jgi:hypothetical protein